MATPQNFRSAFNGFNRDDVVNYISYISAKHESQINQLQTEADQLRQELSERPEIVADSEMGALREELAELRLQLQQKDETISQLQKKMSSAAAVEVPAAPASPALSASAEEELKAYRRAENAERRAMERAGRMYTKAKETLENAVSRVEENAEAMNRMAQQVQVNLEELQTAVEQSKTILQDTAAAVAAAKNEE